MNITAITKTTLLDFPNHIASTLFLQGCNFLCPFCHNKELIPINSTNNIADSIIPILRKRSHLIEGVCITGGEPTLQTDLPDLIRSIKAIGLKVKLDTNGSNPKMLATLLQENLLDYVAIDFKNSMSAYPETSGKSLDLNAIILSLHHLTHYMDNHFSFELRTTLLKEFHSLERLSQMAEEFLALGISKDTPWYLQQYVYSPMQITPIQFTPIEKETLALWLESLKNIHPSIYLRGYD